MTVLVNNLRLLRDTVAGAGLESAAALLNDMIVQQTILPGLQAARAGDVASDLTFWREYKQAVADEGRPPEAAPAETLDTAALQAYLASLPGESGVSVIAANTVSRGFSKKTVLVSLAGGARLSDEIALRMDQNFNYLGTTVTDEYPWLQQLWRFGARIPQPFALEASGTVLGQKFLVSARVGGRAIGGNYVSPPRNPALIADIAEALAGIHAVPVAPLRGLADETPHIAREIEQSYADWRAVGAECATMEAGFDWVRAHQHLAAGNEAIVHNDFNFNNMMIEDGRLVAVVDWEFAHLGNPAADLGYFYYSAENVASFDYFLDRYAAAGGTVPEAPTLAFFVFWGQLRLAVMGFQASAGFNAGQFKDIRFAATLGHLRSGMLRVCEKLMEFGA